MTEAADFFAGYRALMRHWQSDVFAPPLPPGAPPLPLLEVGGSCRGPHPFLLVCVLSFISLSLSIPLSLSLFSFLSRSEVRYEDLVCDPAAAARSVANFLGLDYQVS